MAEPQTALRGGPALQAAAAAVRAGERAAAAGCTDLSWDSLLEWPRWADGGAAERDLPQRLGALWHAAVLRQCIDGRVLQAAAAVLGEAVLQQVLRAQAPAPGAAALPAAEHLADAFSGCGRAVALAAIEDADLRHAVAMALGVPVPTLAGLAPGVARQMMATVEGWAT